MKTDTSAWLVATKLRPPAQRSDTISRPRLEATLGHSVGTLSVTLLSAPAGYGKTTLLAALPRLLPRHPLAWVTLDPEDNDPARFLSLLTVALEGLHQQCGTSVWPLLSAGSAGGAELKRAVGVLINNVLEFLPDPFILVLDDLHFITVPAVYALLEYLLDHQPSQMHIAIGTRYDPPLRLARLGGRRELAEIRLPDLSFRQDEARELLNGVLGLNLSASEVSALQDRTEGWPAVLCLLSGPLCRMDLHDERSRFMSNVAHSERYALDYLAEEVLRYIPDDVRRFLLQTSVLSDMTPSVCRAVTGREDSDEVLEGLYHQNLTIAAVQSEDEGEPAYRHHALFAKLLSRVLEREMPDAIAELHKRAAQAEKTPGRAISHYLAAGLWGEAARLMVESGPELLTLGMSETIRGWYRSLPAPERAKHPRLTTLLGRCEIHRGDYAAAIPLLNSARDGFVAAGDVQGEAATVPSLITLACQNGDQKTASALVDRALTLPLSPMGRVSATLARAWIRLYNSDWSGVLADLGEALSVLQSTNDRPAALMGVTYLAAASLFAVPGCLELTARFGAHAASIALPDTALRLGADEIGLWPLLLTGQVDEAFALAEDVESRRQWIAGYPVLGNDATALLSVLYLVKGETNAAGDAADRLLKRIDNAPRTKHAFYLHAAARTLATLGRLAEATAVLSRLEALIDDLPLTRYLRSHLGAQIALMDGRYSDASAACELAIEQELSLPIAWIGGSARLLKARLLLDEGRSVAAVESVAPVLKEWDSAGYLGRILLDGPVIVPVLRHAAQSGDGIAARASAFFGVGTVVPGDGSCPGLAEQLTPREREVLKLIAAGRTNRQIGKELYITEETVKSHVVHILRKLDVTSRTQAAVRGRELGL